MTFIKKQGCALLRWQDVALISCPRPAYTEIMRHITLSAAGQLIDKARENERAQGASLNDEFRKWLVSCVQDGNPQDAVTRFSSVMLAMPPWTQAARLAVTR